MGEAALPCWTRCVLTGALRSLLGERLEALVELRTVDGGREGAGARGSCGGCWPRQTDGLPGVRSLLRLNVVDSGWMNALCTLF